MRVSEWCTKFGYEVVPAEQRPDAALWPGDTKFVVADLFTTRDGLWDNSNPGKPGVIPDWARCYDVPAFDDRGGATHIFACLIDDAAGSGGKPVTNQPMFAFWSAGYEKLAELKAGAPPSWLTLVKGKPASGWANVMLEHGSGFNWPAGVKGAWCVTKMPGLSDVVRYVGLPGSEHISTFVAFREVKRGTVPPVQPPVSDKETIVALIGEAQARLGRALELIG